MEYATLLVGTAPILRHFPTMRRKLVFPISLSLFTSTDCRHYLMQNISDMFRTTSLPKFNKIFSDRTKIFP